MTSSLSCSIQYKKHRVQLVVLSSTCKLQLIPDATTLQKPICNFEFKWHCWCKCAYSCFGLALGLGWHWCNIVFSNGKLLLVCFYAQDWYVVQTKVHVCALRCPFPLPPPKIHLIVIHLPLHPHPLTLNLWRIPWKISQGSTWYHLQTRLCSYNWLECQCDDRCVLQSTSVESVEGAGRLCIADWECCLLYKLNMDHNCTLPFTPWWQFSPYLLVHSVQHWQTGQLWNS